jgi:hypothetical protein
MAVRLICEGFARIEAFKTGAKEWDEGIDLIDAWQKTYSFDSGYKDIFYSLLQTGECITVSEERASLVASLLEHMGYWVQMRETRA